MMNLEYPVPGGWDIDDHGRFHTVWVHDDGSKLVRSSVPNERDTWKFELDGEEVERITTDRTRASLRSGTVELLCSYNDVSPSTAEEFLLEQKKEENSSLADFGTVDSPQAQNDTGGP